MIKTILVPATGEETDLISFTTALSIARAFSAHIDALHFRLDPIDVAVAMTTEASGGTLLPGVIEQLERDAAAREAKAKSIFADFCTGEDLALCDAPAAEVKAAATAQWHVEIGDEARLVAAYGMTADLIVAGRGGNDDATARSSLEAALLETGRPLLIPNGDAPTGLIGGTVAIAWKPTPQAAHAVAAAMPFLARAKEILVMTVEEGEWRTDSGRLVRNLAWHGLTATARVLAPNEQGAAQTLLAAARDQAQLLVMGGYGHSRLREWIFGGFTQQVLTGAPLPVLITH
jgi:nucleotide-binding universal stress UspA family protein